MTQPKRRPRLDEDQIKILKVLKEAADDGEGTLVHVNAVQRESGVLWIRGPLDSLKRRDLIDHNGARVLAERYWKITDAGREAIS